MRQAVVARSFCAGRSHGIASRRFLPGSRNAPLASLPQRFLLGSRHAPLAGLTQNTLPGSRHAPCRASDETLPVANAVSAPEQGLAKLLCKALGGNRSSTRKPGQSVREPERSVQEPEQSDEEPRVRVGEPLPSESEGPAAPESEDSRTRIGRPAAPESEDQPHQDRRTSAPESEDSRT